MADAGFFKGTSTDQDRRFSDKEIKLMKSMKFPPEFDQKVDMRKVNLNVIRPWIAKKVVEYVGIEDDIVIEYANSLLEDESQPVPDPRKMQIHLTGFLTKDSAAFMKELWSLLLEAQNDVTGVPRTFVEQKKEEIRKARANDTRALEERDRRATLEDAVRQDRGADSRGRGRGRGNGRGRGRGRGGFEDRPRDGGWGARGQRTFSSRSPPRYTRRRSRSRSRTPPSSRGGSRTPRVDRSGKRSLSRTNSSRSPPTGGRRRSLSPPPRRRYPDIRRSPRRRRDSRSPPRRRDGRSLSRSPPPRRRYSRSRSPLPMRRRSSRSPSRDSSRSPPPRRRRRFSSGSPHRRRSPPRSRKRSLSSSSSSPKSPPRRRRRPSFTPTPEPNDSLPPMDIDSSSELKIKGSASREVITTQSDSRPGKEDLTRRESQLKEGLLRSKVIKSRKTTN